MIRRTLVATVAAVALAAGLAGCASPSKLDAEAGAQLQASVVEVAQAAASGDIAGALVQLDEVEAQLDAAIEADAVTAARAARIQTAIDSVRTDLEALVPPEPVTTPTEPQTEPQTEPADEDDDKGGGSENSGPGNNNGKGNDKGKKDD